MFWGNLFAIVGIVLLTMGALGIVALNKFNQEIKEEERSILEDKLYTIAQDLEIQIDTLQETSMLISLLDELNFEDFRQNKYREMLMMDSISRYKPVCNICDFFFLKYKDSERIFTSNATVMKWDFYLKKFFPLEQHDDVKEMIQDVGTRTTGSMGIYKHEDRMLFVYSLEQYNVIHNDQDTVICYQITEQDLMQRINTLVGGMDGNIYIEYKGVCLLGNETREDAFTSEHRDVMTHVSQDREIVIQYRSDESRFSVWKEIFSGEELLFLIVCMILVLMFGILIARWNFKPVQRIAKKLGSGSEGELSADWDGIEMLVESLLQGSERDSSLLKSQYQILREQTTLLVISGKYSKRVQEHMTVLNIRIDAPVYGVIRCRLDQRFRPEELDKSLYRDVKDLAGEGISLYPCWDHLRDFCILAAVDEEYQLEEVAEMLQELFMAKEITAEIGIEGAYSKLEEIGKVSMKNKADQTESETLMFDVDVQASRLSPKQNQMVKHALEYIEANYTSYDVSLDSIAEDLHISSGHLSRLIKQETGLNYKEYLSRLRMEFAKNMLKDPAVSVMDVSQQVGYNNVSHFIKVFQKYTGMTPARYRDEQWQ